MKLGIGSQGITLVECGRLCRAGVFISLCPLEGCSGALVDESTGVGLDVAGSVEIYQVPAMGDPLHRFNSISRDFFSGVHFFFWFVFLNRDKLTASENCSFLSTILKEINSQDVDNLVLQGNDSHQRDAGSNLGTSSFLLCDIHEAN